MDGISRGVEEGAESAELWADSQWGARAYSWVSGGRTEDEEGGSTNLSRRFRCSAIYRPLECVDTGR
jgi:hypothetical protein